MASSIRDGIMKNFHLSCSIGGGPNKLAAKMATGLDKPRGLTLISLRDFRRVFWPRPVEDLMGVGEKTGVFLRRLGLHTIGDLAAANPRRLATVMGSVADYLVAGARGEESSPVIPFEDAVGPKSLGHEHTAARDLASEAELTALLLALVDKVGYDMRQGGFLGRTVVLKLRTASFRTMTRQSTLAEPTNENRIIYAACRKLLRRHAPPEPIRLLGVKMGKLSSPEGSLHRLAPGDPLLPEDRRYRRLLQTIDRVNKNHGTASLFRAATMPGW
jgi:DNA polymerase-4